MTDLSEITKVAIYCRLSREDRYKANEDDDSRSIVTQKLMLQEYANKHNWLVTDIYSDDDFSGSDSDRPEFNRMIADAQNRKFSIILCKDQSRFARDMIIVEKYINRLFPIWGIRFIGVSDGTDTDETNNKKSRQIKGLVDEWYLEDMSERIKSSLHTRMRQGLFIGSFAPYGYSRCPDNKNLLIIDEEAADIVRLIFKLYTVDHMSQTSITRYLNNKGIPNPAMYKEQKGIVKNVSNKKYNYLWRHISVHRILSSEAYIGNLVQHKRKNVTYHSKYATPSPKDEYIRVENTHEPIIDMGTWNEAQRIMNSRTKPFSTICKGDVSPYPENLFAKKLYCKYCGYRLSTAIKPEKNVKQRYYHCKTRKSDKNACQGVTIFHTTLYNYVLAEIKKMVDTYLDTNQIKSSLKLKEQANNQKAILKTQIAEYKKKILGADNYLASLYMDKVNGEISSQQFVSLSAKFEADKSNYLAKQEQLETELATLQEEKSTQESKEDIIKKYANCERLTASMVDALIDKIYIGGSRDHREYEIHWKF